MYTLFKLSRKRVSAVFVQTIGAAGLRQRSTLYRRTSFTIAFRFSVQLQLGPSQQSFVYLKTKLRVADASRLYPGKLEEKNRDQRKDTWYRLPFPRPTMDCSVFLPAVPGNSQLTRGLACLRRPSLARRPRLLLHQAAQCWRRPSGQAFQAYRQHRLRPET